LGATAAERWGERRIGAYPRRPPTFAVVELLVAVAVIAMFAALLLPAVQQA
jgi:Tfp pilus assembly protein FimT